ncbi:MAG: exonuclease SbcCD subunit D [Paludibacteraceae bacterium]
MKIFHTSDWHLGHILYNFDRREEQMSMLDQMVEIVRSERPDVFLLCGDVYHTPQPSAAVQEMFTNAVVALHDANPAMTIVITAGNHDSGTRHEIFRTPWEALNVHTIGNIDREHPENHIIAIADKGFVVAVPYANERNIPNGFFKQLLDSVQTRNENNLPIVMSAHTTVRGCDFTGHDLATDYMVGGIDAFDLEQFGNGYDYLALGHIHHAQFVHSGQHNVRYSGTPVAVSFDETYTHSVSIVEIAAHNIPPIVNQIEIQNPHPLVTLPTEGMATWESAKQLLADYPADIPAYIRLNVEVENYLPANATAEAQALTHGKKCRLCHINTKRKTMSNVNVKTLTVQEFQQENPKDIVRRYATDIGITFDDEMSTMFEETIRLISEDLHNDN